jgi:hypothetical protein
MEAAGYARWFERLLIAATILCAGNWAELENPDKPRPKKIATIETRCEAQPTSSKRSTGSGRLSQTLHDSIVRSWRSAMLRRSRHPARGRKCAKPRPQHGLRRTATHRYRSGRSRQSRRVHQWLIRPDKSTRGPGLLFDSLVATWSLLAREVYTRLLLLALAATVLATATVPVI